MFDYLQQFNNLPKDIRDQVSSPDVMAILNELEKKYQVDLAVLVMKVMIKSLSLKSLPTVLMEESGLDQLKAASLSEEMTKRIFSRASEYLQITKPVQAPEKINKIIVSEKLENPPVAPLSKETGQKEKIIMAQGESSSDNDLRTIISASGIMLPSSDLETRFKTIISTYLRGVRSKIATRDALAKEINLGGLNLSQTEIDRVLSSADKLSSATGLKKEVSLKAPSALDKIISSDLAAIKNQEYDFKKALESGQVSRFDYKKALAVSTAKEDIKTQKEKTVNQNLIKMVAAPSQSLPLSAPLEMKRLTFLEGTGKENNSNLVHQNKPPQVAGVKEVPQNTLNNNQANSSLNKKPDQADKILSNNFILSEVNNGEKKKSSEDSRVIEKSSAPNRPVIAVAAARSSLNLKESQTKPVLQDIKAAPRVMGPVEELQFLDLVNFRRLGQNPAEISAKILSKIKLLEADGYDRMIAGVRAWRRSPVNVLYIKMVQEAISRGQTIKDLAASLEKNTEKYLSLAEIEEIISLNSKLIF